MSLQNEILVRAQITMDISKFFNFLSKKNDLNDQSCNGEEPKKVREGSLNDSVFQFDYVFTDGIKSPECLHILVSCMKNIEAKIKEIGEISQVT